MGPIVTNVSPVLYTMQHYSKYLKYKYRYLRLLALLGGNGDLTVRLQGSDKALSLPVPEIPNLENLRSEINERLGIPNEDQELFVDGRRATDADVVPGAKLTVVDNRPPRTFFVSFPDGIKRGFELSLSPPFDLERLKAAIESETGLKPGNYELKADSGENATDADIDEGEYAFRLDMGRISLGDAVRTNNVRLVKFVLENYPVDDVNARDFYGDTLLHVATQYKGVCERDVWNEKTCFHEIRETESEYLPIVELLLKKGADPNIKNEDGDTPLHIAAINAYDRIVELMLDFQADPNRTNRDGDTPLHKAVEYAYHQIDWKKSWDYKPYCNIVKLLLNHSANPNMRGQDGKVPLHWLSSDCVTSLLLKARADPDIQDEYGNAPLHLSCAYKFPNKHLLSGTNMLLEAGANPNIQNRDKVTPLHLAAQNNDVYFLKQLLAAQANPNIRDAVGKTPLHYAAATARDASHISELLVANADPNIQDLLGQTPLHEAAGSSEIFQQVEELLLKAGADPNLKDHQGKTYIQLVR